MNAVRPRRSILSFLLVALGGLVSAVRAADDPLTLVYRSRERPIHYRFRQTRTVEHIRPGGGSQTTVYVHRKRLRQTVESAARGRLSVGIELIEGTLGINGLVMPQTFKGATARFLLEPRGVSTGDQDAAVDRKGGSALTLPAGEVTIGSTWTSTARLDDDCPVAWTVHHTLDGVDEGQRIARIRTAADLEEVRGPGGVVVTGTAEGAYRFDLEGYLSSSRLRTEFDLDYDRPTPEGFIRIRFDIVTAITVED